MIGNFSNKVCDTEQRKGKSKGKEQTSNNPENWQIN
jgi:hypothetical protein